VEKCSELGLTTLVPLYTARTIVRDVPERLANRVARWQRVAEAAARQCGRRTLLEVCSPVSVQDFCVHYQAAAVKIVCWEAERHQGLRQLLAADLPPGPVVALVGPEGGLSAEEVALASTYGFRAVSLGPQLLRTETAAIALTTMVRYSLGAFEPREEWYEEDTAGTP
jgi:16S rRNA (uracil1498-N3)-methyltransferase